MSLEAKIDALVGAVEKLTSAVEAQTSLVEGGIAKAGAKTTPSKTAEKPAPKKAAVKTPTVAAMKKSAEEFLELAGEDEDAYADRRAHVIATAKKFEVDRFSEIAAKDRLDALDHLETFDADGGGEEEEQDNGI